ncbi:MAG: DHH family phosphoesterase [Planctomycetota bacterium]|nr:DHH family phosphoesterase [Planctomycetota bacterium]MDA1179638.1 DHH family phosphoesterase [Planctomycetota bacterium]
MAAIDWKQFGKELKSAQSVLITSHVRPDCDALGSELGMARVLEKMGKRVCIVNSDITPPNLQFIDPDKRILSVVDCDGLTLRNDFDAMLIVDTSAWVQLGAMADVFRETRAKKFVLDHHQSSDDLQAIVFRDVTAEATGCLVVQAAAAWDIPLDPIAATPLFAAVATDTGWFRFPSAQSPTYEVAAQLIRAGASPSDIYANLYERDTVGRLKLRGVVLSRAKTELNGQLIHTYIKKDDFSETGAVPSDTEDLINLTLAVQGTRFGLIFVEQISRGVKVSFRSRCVLDCSQLAAEFGGGGHKAAAGAFIESDLESARRQVLARVRQAMSDLEQNSGGTPH